MESCQRRPRISEGRRSSEEEARVATRRRSRNSSHIRGGRDRVLPFFFFSSVRADSRQDHEGLFSGGRANPGFKSRCNVTTMVTCIV